MANEGESMHCLNDEIDDDDDDEEEEEEEERISTFYMIDGLINETNINSDNNNNINSIG